MYIETERTIVRDFSMGDLNDLQKILGDDEVMEYMEPAYSIEKTEAFLSDFCIGRRGALACQHKESGRVIGYILFKGPEEGVYELGWIFARDFWRQGFAYEAMRALIHHAFTQLNAHKLFAEAIDPVRSVGLMKKLGMRPEGVQRSHTRDNKGNWADLYFYGLLAEEYCAESR